MATMTDEFRTRISLGDTDAFGVIYWGAPVAWAQTGLENLWRAAGHPVEECLRSSVDYPVVSARIDYRKPLSLGDEISVRTAVERVGGRSLTIATTVRDADDDVAVEVTRVLVAVDRNGGAPAAADWLRALAPA